MLEFIKRLTTWYENVSARQIFWSRHCGRAIGRLNLESLDIGQMLQVIFGRVYAEKYSQYASQFAIWFFVKLINAQLNGDVEGD